MNMQRARGAPEPSSCSGSRSLGLAFMLTSESTPDVMDSKPQSLCSSFSITAANGHKDAKPPPSSSEIGDARPKPPVKPKPCVLPKPAVPVKPISGLRQTLSEVPSAEKINLLAGPKPYSGGAGSAVKRPCFNLRCSPKEVANGKEVPSSFSTASKSSEDKEDAEPTKKPSAVERASEEECRESSSVAKCTLPFKVKPVPVATKPERFPGTTVEEILAKMEKPSENSPSCDRPRLVRSFFSQDGGSNIHLGPKSYVAFRRSSSGEEGVGTDPEGSAYRVSSEVKRSLSRNKELKEEDSSLNEQRGSESQQPETEVKINEIFLPTDSSSPPSTSCEGDQLESSSPRSSPGAKFSSRVTPGSPDAPSETTQPPGAPYLPTDVQCSEALLPPGSPDGSAKSPRGSLADAVSRVPFADPTVTLADPWPPGSPMKTSPGQPLLSNSADVSARYPEATLPPEHTASLTHPPVEHNLQSRQCLTGVSESPGSPSILSKCHACSDQPPGSPSCLPDTPLNRGEGDLKIQAQILPLEEKAPLLNQRRASEGVVQAQSRKMAREELGGSLAALPREKDPPVEQTLGGDSSWSLSQSFEWSFPNRGLELSGKRLVSPPNSPIQEHDDDSLLEAQLGGEVPPIQGSYQEAGSEGGNGKEEETEASEHRANKESESNWKEVEGQLEGHSTLELSAPGGPSVQRTIGSPSLRAPVVAEEVTFQEDRDDFLQFPPSHEEEALRAMEPLPSVEETAPPAEPCILFSESAQIQTADTCQEEDDALAMAQEAKMENSDLLGGVEPGSSSHWLDELLASPPPSADDTKKRSTSEMEDPAGPQDLLGWSRKDLCSEFGIVRADHSDTFGLDWTADATKVKWLGETEQDREFGTGSQDWPNSYTVGNAKNQDMEFGTNQQEWTRGSPLLGSPSPVQEEWLASYGSHGADHPTEESNWTSAYGINTDEGQPAEPYMRKPGWPTLCHAGGDQQSSEFVVVEKTDWSSQYHAAAAAETTEWPTYQMENISCPESGVSPELAKVASEYTIESQLETEFSAKRSDDTTPVSMFSASHLGWPSGSDSGSGTSQPQREFTAHQVELSHEPQSRPEAQLSFQQGSRPDTYGFDDGSYPESKLNVKQCDSPSRCDTEIAPNQFSAGKSDGAKEYNDEIGCRIETDGGSNSQMEVDNQEFHARRPVWADEYCLGKFEPREDTTGRGNWVKDTFKFSECEQNDTTGQDLIAGFGSLDLSDQKVTVDLEESTDNLIHQVGNLIHLAIDEPRGIGEGEPEWTQHLDAGELAISGDLKVENLEAYEEPAKKHLDWVSPFGMETSSATPNPRLVNAEEGREPDVGQADLINNMDLSDRIKTDVTGLRPKALDGAEVAYTDGSCRLGATSLVDDVMQHQGATPVCGERKCHSQRLSSPSCLLEGMVSSSASRPELQQKRPASFHSCHLEEGRKLNTLPSELVPAAEKIRPSPFPLEDVGEVLSDTDGDIRQWNSGNGSQPPERQSESQSTQPVSQDDCASEGAEALTREKFTFLEDMEILDNSAHRDRANLGRKRGHRAPFTRAGGTVLEEDRDSWMFRDSTEPKLVSAVSDEEVPEESKSKKSRSSPLSKGVKVALFPGLSPSALKAKLRGRNRSAEEGEPQGEVKEAPVQRSKSCKMANTSGKPLVLPPKPEKSSGSESSSPNWLQVLKLKKKKS